MSKAIEFKAGTLTTMTAQVRDSDLRRLTDFMAAFLGGIGESFNGEPTIIDMGALPAEGPAPDIKSLVELLRHHGLQPVAVRGAVGKSGATARKLGLAVLPKVAPRPGAEVPSVAQEAVADEVSPPEGGRGGNTSGGATAPVEAAHAAPVAVQTFPEMRVIDRPVRSGQQIYVRGGDLVLLCGVSPGAEVIADGSIHCHGPLRGRALAGAQGNTAARIFSTDFGPELVSIAGVYRTFEQGIPAQLAAKSVQAMLRNSETKEPAKGGTQEALTLDIQALQAF